MAEPAAPQRIVGLPPRAWRHLMRAVQSGRILPYLFGVAAISSCAMALVMRLVDRETFTTYGKALWFSVVTLMTVGYGDVVPGNSVGRVFASVLMILGVTFIAFITAVVTSALIISEQRRVESTLENEPSPEEPLHSELLARIEQRLEAIEKKLPG